MDKYTIPRHIDAPFRVFLLTIDEFMLLVTPIILIGFVLGQVVLGFAIGMGGLAAMKRFKGEQGHYYLVNLTYWYMPNIIKLHVTPPSHIRTYLG